MTIWSSTGAVSAETKTSLREVSNNMRSLCSTYSPGRIPEIENSPAESVTVLAFIAPLASRSVICTPDIDAPAESSTCPVMVTEFADCCAIAHPLAKMRHRHMSVGERKMAGEHTVCFIPNASTLHGRHSARIAADGFMFAPL